MAPPKRKTGGSGRVTPKGTQPGDRRAVNASGPDHAVAASSRYTPKAKRRELVPASWIPVIMLVLLIGGGVMIMIRYLAWDSNVPIMLGLLMILAGLYTATKWR